LEKLHRNWGQHLIEEEEIKKKENTLFRPSYKPDEVVEEDTGETWLTSYADLMTLVACFFIMMMAFANFDSPSFRKMAKDVGKHFRGANLQVKEDEFTELTTDLETMTHDIVKMKLKSSIDGAEIIFKSSYLFDPGSADLKDDVLETMDLVIQSIMRKSKDYFIEIEGHADAINTFSLRNKFHDNWTLSSARAAAIVRVFEKNAYPINQMRAVGYGLARPKHPHYDLTGAIIRDNLQENRRIVVKISKIDKKDFGLLYDTPTE
jgi:chemotaxis protein MotB